MEDKFDKLVTKDEAWVLNFKSVMHQMIKEKPFHVSLNKFWNIIGIVGVLLLISGIVGEGMSIYAGLHFTNDWPGSPHARASVFLEGLGLYGIIPGLLAFLSKELLIGLISVLLSMAYVILIFWLSIMFLAV